MARNGLTPPLPPSPQLVRATYKDIFFSFVLMGWTAFGGPAAHIGIFQKAFVEVRARAARDDRLPTPKTYPRPPSPTVHSLVPSAHPPSLPSSRVSVGCP